MFGYVPQAIQFDPLYPLTGFDVALMGVLRARRAGPVRSASANATFVRECLRATAAEEFAAQTVRRAFRRAKAARAHRPRAGDQPDVLVLDEPTAGVDAAATHALLEFISQIHEERKLTILLVTHDLPLVRKHAQQVIWLHRRQGACTARSRNCSRRERMAEIFEMEISLIWNTLHQILSPDFLLRNSVYTSVLIGFACPLVGVFLVLRRLVFMGVALPQISSTGVAIALSLPLWLGRCSPSTRRTANICWLSPARCFLAGGHPRAGVSGTARTRPARRPAGHGLRRRGRLEHPAAVEKPLCRSRLARLDEGRNHHD